MIDAGTTPPDVPVPALTAYVRSLLEDESAAIIAHGWSPLAFAPLSRITAGLYRCAGTARSRGAVAPWSLIVKALHPPGGPETTPDDPHYWKREALVYPSGVLDGLPDGLAAPRCLGVEWPREDIAWIWMEDVAHETAGRWPVERFAEAARHLGRWNGGYLAGPSIPDHPWLSRRYLDRRCARAGPFIGRFAETDRWPEPFGRVEASALGAGVRRLWSERGRLSAALASLPATLCHFDANRGNLFSRARSEGTTETVVIDWAFTGHGVAGQDLAQLVLGPLTDFELGPSDLPLLDDEAFAGYLAGLRDAGWAGDAARVRLGFTVAAALQWCFGPLLGLAITSGGLDALVSKWRRPADELVDRWCALTTYALRLADEARTLLEG